VIDDVPRLAVGLLHHDAHVVAIGRGQRRDREFGARVEDHDRAIEEREHRVRAGGRAEAIALPDERVALRGRVRATGVPHLHGAVEDRELTARVDRRDRVARPEHETKAEDEQQQRREQPGDRRTAPRERGQEDRRGGAPLPLRHRRDHRDRTGRGDRRGHAAGRAADRVQQLPRRRVLQDDARRAAVQRGVADARVEREEHDPGVGELGVEAARGLEARHLGHRVIENDQVRPQLERLRHGLQAVGGLTHDLEPGLHLEHRADALSYGEMVVRDEDPCRHFGRLLPFSRPSRGRRRLAGLFACLYDVVRVAKGLKTVYPSSGGHWYEADVGWTVTCRRGRQQRYQAGI
jgi:hypothetical protein